MRKLTLLLALCMVTIAASASKTVYLVPGPWDDANATERYALYMYNSETDNAWVAFTEGADGIWNAEFDDAYAKMIICRQNGATVFNAENDWGNKWNQTANLDAPTVDGMFYVNKSASIGDSPWLQIINPNPNAGDDMTAAIANSGITGSADGWTLTGPCRYFNGTGFDGTASFIEFTEWGSSWDATVAQTVSHLKNGYYKVRAAGQMYGSADCWMKIVANGQENFFSRNGDSNGNILANGTETAIGSGVAGWRYSTVIAKVTDGTLAISVVGHSDTNARWANADAFTLTYLGEEIAPNTDVTDFINNWDFWGCYNDAFNGWTIEKTGGNSWVHGNSAVEHWSNDLTRTFDFYQTISDLPEGRYEISASMWNTQGSGPNGNSGVYGTSNGVTAFAGVTDDCGDNDLHTYSTSLFVNNGEMRIGVKNNGDRSAFWFGVDWIKLNYLGKVVQDYAVALPSDGAMAADTWYYFDIEAAADDYKATATTLGDIICTSDGNTLTSATTGNVTLAATNNSLEAIRYYVKSSSANNLVVEAASFVYHVSEATIDKTYIQPGNIVTVSYTVETNDHAATLAQVYNGVTFNGEAVTCTATESGFTFTVSSGIATAAEFTLVIPAGVIGYANGNTFNAEQSFTLKTPAVFDGTYFFKVENDGALKGQYLSRGKDYGTHASIDKYGLAIKVVTDADNKTTLKPFDTDRFYRMGNNSTYDCWADADVNDDNARFNLIASNGHILIHPYSNADVEDYFKYNDDDVAETTKIWGDSHSGSTSSVAHVLEFSIETGAQHGIAMQALKDNQATAAAAAAAATSDYASLNGITTVAALETELTNNYIQGDFVAPTEISSVLEKYQGDQPNPSPETVYSNTIHITEPGFYKFSMQAFYRAGSNGRAQEMHTAGVDYNPVVLFFGDNQTQIKALYDEEGRTEAVVASGWGADSEYNGKFYPNCMDGALQYFKDGMYHNDVWLYVSAEGVYTYGVKYLGYANANAQWFIYSPESVTITSYAPVASDADYTALDAAIAESEGKILGFEADEYAPYNNAEAFAALAAAKALDRTANNSKLIVESAIAAMNVWVANTEEVNAFYKGDFADYAEDTATPLDYTPTGWTATNNFRLMLKNTETYPGLNDASAKSAVMSWSGGITYGETPGYEMPLKPNSVYRLSFKAAGWNNENRGGITVSVLNAEDGLAATDLGTADRDIIGNASNTAGMTSYVKYFKTGAAGNYVFHIQSGYNMVLTDFDLRRPSNVYAVAGSNADIFSGVWDQATQTDYLELNGNEYTKTYADLTLDKQTIEFKVFKKERVESTSAINDASWYPGTNVAIAIPVKGIYDITITFDGNESNPTVTGVAAKTAEAVTIGEKGWATTVTNSPLDFSESGVEAYTATVNESGKVELTKVDDVQAETGLVLKATANTYYLPVIESSETDKGSLLFSSTLTYDIWQPTDGTVNTFYGLTVNSQNEAQFAKINAENGYALPAGKAFLLVNTPGEGARTLSVIFAGDDTTGINAVATENGAEGVYNLNGQRVTVPAKGLYIVNGKKVVLK